MKHPVDAQTCSPSIDSQLSPFPSPWKPKQLPPLVQNKGSTTERMFGNDAQKEVSMTTEPSHMTDQSHFNEGITSKMERADPSGGSDDHT